MMAYGIKHYLFLATAIVLASCSSSSGEKLHKPNPIPAAGPYIVDMDPGGSTQAYAKRWDQLKARGTKVIIRSHATSAAVIFAYLPNACLEPGALLRFHGPRKGGKLVPKDAHLIADRLAPGARAKYTDEWQFVLDGLVDLKREAAIKLDPKLKRCE